MIDASAIIDEYRDADSEKRLHLFLSHRSLRDEFLEIDQNDSTAGFSKKSAKNKCCLFFGQ